MYANAKTPDDRIGIGIGTGYATAPKSTFQANTIRDPGALTRLAGFATEQRQLLDRTVASMTTLLDMAFWPEPEPVSEADAPSPPGVLGQLECELRCIARLTGLLDAQVKRLERFV